MSSIFPPKLVIGLVGTLGAGKTTFTQALAAAAGVNPEDVTSPTFTLLCSYDAQLAAGPIRLHHLDAYRLSDEDEFLELGVEELFETENSWVLIEWADRMKSVLPARTLWITIDVDDSLNQESPNRKIALVTDDQDLQPALALLLDRIGQ
jgi:tRNA threonylcarbamoyladenosine biosynthesis protein TsaE